MGLHLPNHSSLISDFSTGIATSTSSSGDLLQRSAAFSTLASFADPFVIILEVLSMCHVASLADDTGIFEEVMQG